MDIDEYIKRLREEHLTSGHSREHYYKEFMESTKPRLSKTAKYVIGFAIMFIVVSAIMIPLILYGVDTDILNMLGLLLGALVGQGGGYIVINWAEF